MIHKSEMKTIFAVDIDTEMTNPVEKAFKIRDLNKEKGLIKLILKEAEHKIHLKDGTLPKQILTLDPATTGPHLTETKQGENIDEDE